MQNFLQFNVLFSPLEQFEDVTWVYYNVVYENVEMTRNYIFEKEENFFKGVFNVETSSFDNFSFFAFILVAVVFPICVYFTGKGLWLTNFGEVMPSVKKDFTKMMGTDTTSFIRIVGFRFLSLIAIITIFSGFLVSVWFKQNYVVTVNNGIPILDGNIINQTKDVLASKRVSFAIAWDENLISILAGLLLINNDNDEDFILEEEESDFVEDVVAPLFIANLGSNVKENGGLFLKVCGVFSFVLINNLMGMLPYSDTGTSSLILTFWVAFSIFVSLIYMMIHKQGVSHFFGLFMPSGCPLPLIFVLIPIEFISYSFRLVSLSVRLFANMMAGHTLLKVIVGFSWSMILMGDLFLIANLFPISILFVLTFLELGVAIIQSYIFTILTCIYLKDIFEAH